MLGEFWQKVGKPRNNATIFSKHRKKQLPNYNSTRILWCPFSTFKGSKTRWAKSCLCKSSLFLWFFLQTPLIPSLHYSRPGFWNLSSRDSDKHSRTLFSSCSKALQYLPCVVSPLKSIFHITLGHDCWQKGLWPKKLEELSICPPLEIYLVYWNAHESCSR